jgi:hypothetical protein
VAAAVRARLLALSWGVVVGLVIVLELIYVGSGYMLSARQPQDRALAVAILLISVMAGLWLIPTALRNRAKGHRIAPPTHREAAGTRIGRQSAFVALFDDPLRQVALGGARTGCNDTLLRIKCL